MRYTHYFEPQSSSVLSQVWYNVDDQRLAVQLHNGTIAGYEGVPLDVYNAFSKQEELGASAGSYWNLWIKPHFTGFSTADLVGEEDFEPKIENEPNYFVWNGPDPAKQAFIDNGDAREVGIGKFEQDQIDALNRRQEAVANEVAAEPATVRTVRIEFTFERGMEDFEGSLIVFAADVDNAREVFYTVADALGYENPVVKVASVYFD